MALKKRQLKSKTPQKKNDGSPPNPFKRPPEVLEPFISALSPEHIYITSIDSRPATFKRKMFLAPITLNVLIVALFALRMWWILPWYFKVVVSGLGHPNETTFPADAASWKDIALEVGKRAFTMFVDFLLLVFLWPWPVEFVATQAHGNPTKWRWNVGFREKEIYVRRSRDWDELLGDIFKDENGNKIFLAYVQQATSPMQQEQKTGYLLMNGQWNLDWDCMVYGHALVDKKEIALETFKNLVLIHHQDYGWLVYDIKTGVSAKEDEKRRQVFKFRDALTAMSKEKLFYRWVEIVQFEATQPGGFGPEKQEAAAKKIRDLFQEENVDFDELWKEIVGTEGLISL